jgi:hypothetical protein
LHSLHFGVIILQWLHSEPVHIFLASYLVRCLEVEEEGGGSNDQSARVRQRRLATATRYRAHAFDLRELAKSHRTGMMRRRLLEIAAEFDHLAADLERDGSSK